MIIVSRENDHIINMENVTEVYGVPLKKALRVNYINGTGCQLESFDTEKEVVTACEMLVNQINRGNEVIKVPTAEQIKAYLIKDVTQPHHATGKKTKGHGTLYACLGDEGRKRELRASELTAICFVLKINPMDFAGEN